LDGKNATARYRDMDNIINWLCWNEMLQEEEQLKTERYGCWQPVCVTI